MSEGVVETGDVKSIMFLHVLKTLLDQNAAELTPRGIRLDSTRMNGFMLEDLLWQLTPVEKRCNAPFVYADALNRLLYAGRFLQDPRDPFHFIHHRFNLRHGMARSCIDRMVMQRATWGRRAPAQPPQRSEYVCLNVLCESEKVAGVTYADLGTWNDSIPEFMTELDEMSELVLV